MSSPIKPTLKTEIIPVLLIVLAIAASFYFYPRFGERVPSHWNFQGQVDGWSGRKFAAFGLPAIGAGIYLMFLAIPYLDPKREKYAQFASVYHIFKTAIIFIFVSIYLIASLNALGYDLPVNKYVPALIGLLFIILGNYMGKLKPNWFMGIRTPWTLSSDTVWNKTHRFGGKAFVLAGIVMALQPFVPFINNIAILLIIVFGLVGSTFLYSYLVYREEKLK